MANFKQFVLRNETANYDVVFATIRGYKKKPKPGDKPEFSAPLKTGGGYEISDEDPLVAGATSKPFNPSKAYSKIKFLELEIEAYGGKRTTRTFFEGKPGAEDDLVDYVVKFSGIDENTACVLSGYEVPPPPKHTAPRLPATSFTRFRFVNVPPSTHPVRKATYTGYSGLNRIGALLIAPKRLVDEALPGYPPPLTLPIRILLPGGVAAEDYDANQIADQVMSVALEHTADAYDGPVHTLVIQKSDATYLMEVIVQFQGIDNVSGLYIAQVTLRWTDGATDQWDPPYTAFY